MPGTIGYPAPELLRGDKAEEMIRIARSRLEHGKQFRQKKREEVWKQSERQFEGNHWEMTNTPNDPTADLVVINVSFSTATTLVPYITGSDPRFLVEPYSSDASVRNARAQGAWLNRYWRTQDSGARPAVVSAAHDSIIYGLGYGKATYQINERADGAEIAEIKIDAVSPWDIWIDPMADSFHKARWVIQRIRTTLGELRDDGTFENLDEVQTGLRELEDDSERVVDAPMTGPDSDYAWVELYEFWDLVKKRLVVFAEAGPLPLKVVEDVKCPIVPIENHWLPKQPYRMGDLEQIWPMQQELNKSRSQMLTHRRRNILKYLVKAGALDAQGEQALISEVVGEMVKVIGDQELDSIIKPVAAAPLTADIYNVTDLITRDIYEVTGVNEYLRGATPQIRRTATEASIIEGASNVKVAHKLGKVEEFVRDLGTLVLGIAADVFPLTDYDELELYITGRDAESLNRAEMGERITELQSRGAPNEILAEEAQGMSQYGSATLSMGPDIFEGVYQVEVVQNSTELRNPLLKEQKYREMTQMMLEATPILAQTGIQINLRKFFEMWFESAGIQDIEDLFIEQPQGQIPQGQMPGQPGQPGPQPGAGQDQPNMAGLGAPEDFLSFLNTGAMPPEAGQ